MKLKIYFSHFSYFRVIYQSSFRTLKGLLKISFRGRKHSLIALYHADGFLSFEKIQLFQLTFVETLLISMHFSHSFVLYKQFLFVGLKHFVRDKRCKDFLTHYARQARDKKNAVQKRFSSKHDHYSFCKRKPLSIYVEKEKMQLIAK